MRMRKSVSICWVSRTGVRLWCPGTPTKQSTQRTWYFAVAGDAARRLPSALARERVARAVPAAHLAHRVHRARRRGAVGATPAAFARAAAQRARAVARAVGLARELRAPCLEEGEGEGRGER